MTGFIIGLIVGVSIGMIFASCLAVVGESDRCTECIYDKRRTQ